jgi:6-phosphogluconolactonase
VLFTPDNRFLITADLGIDKLLVYRFDAATGALTPNDPASASLPAGAGPRHIALDPSGRYLYAINELVSTITTLSWQPDTGELAALSTVPTRPEGFTEGTTAEIVVHPSGRYVYGSNRGHDSVAVFSADATGALTLVEIESTRGEEPRNFALDPSGRWLVAANQHSDTLAVFSVNPDTGALAPAGDLVDAPTPVSVLFMP